MKELIYFFCFSILFMSTLAIEDKNCKADNCLECNSGNADICIKCSNFYLLNDGKCYSK